MNPNMTRINRFSPLPVPDGRRLIEIAIRSNDEQRVKELAIPAHLHKYYSRSDPLELALTLSTPSIVQILIEHGAKLKRVEQRKHRYPSLKMITAEVVENKLYDLLEAIVNVDKDYNDNVSYYYNLLTGKTRWKENRIPELVFKLSKLNFGINQHFKAIMRPPQYGRMHTSPLKEAIEVGDLNLIKRFVKYGGSVLEVDDEGNNSLHFAVSIQVIDYNYNVITYLLSQGCNPESVNYSGESCWDLLCLTNHPERSRLIANLFVANGFDMKINLDALNIIAKLDANCRISSTRLSRKFMDESFNKLAMDGTEFQIAIMRKRLDMALALIESVPTENFNMSLKLPHVILNAIKYCGAEERGLNLIMYLIEEHNCKLTGFSVTSVLFELLKLWKSRLRQKGMNKLKRLLDYLLRFDQLDVDQISPIYGSPLQFAPSLYTVPDLTFTLLNRSKKSDDPMLLFKVIRYWSKRDFGFEKILKLVEICKFSLFTYKNTSVLHELIKCWEKSKFTIEKKRIEDLFEYFLYIEDIDINFLSTKYGTPLNFAISVSALFFAEKLILKFADITLCDITKLNGKSLFVDERFKRFMESDSDSDEDNNPFYFKALKFDAKSPNDCETCLKVLKLLYSAGYPFTTKLIDQLRLKLLSDLEDKKRIGYLHFDQNLTSSLTKRFESWFIKETNEIRCLKKLTINKLRQIYGSNLIHIIEEIEVPKDVIDMIYLRK